MCISMDDSFAHPSLLCTALDEMQVAIVLEYMDGGSLGDVLEKVRRYASCFMLS